MTGKWLVQVFGRRETGSFEISIVREDNEHGRRSWGWFDHNKLLVCHNGAGKIVLTESIWNWQNAIANEVCEKLNGDEERMRSFAPGARLILPVDGYKVSHES